MRKKVIVNLSRLYKIQYLSGLSTHEFPHLLFVPKKSDVRPEERLIAPTCIAANTREIAIVIFIDNLPSRLADY